MSNLLLKKRALVYISGSVYVALPKEWLNHHLNLNHFNEDKVCVSIDEKQRLIIEPSFSKELKSSK